eukprot:9445428-Pyramimonas_sp.AAC.1
MVAVCAMDVQPATGAALLSPSTPEKASVAMSIGSSCNRAVSSIVTANASSHGLRIEKLKLTWAQSCVICVRGHHAGQERLADAQHQAVRAGFAGLWAPAPPSAKGGAMEAWPSWHRPGSVCLSHQGGLQPSWFQTGPLRPTCTGASSVASP